MVAYKDAFAGIKFSPRRIAHVNMFVSDVERSLEFYNRVCGFEIVLRQPEIGGGFLSNGNTHHDIGLIQTRDEELRGQDGHRITAAGQASKPGIYHFGWEMETERQLVEAYERARERGLPIFRTVRHRSCNSVYLFDPDGNIHEFYADVTKEWRERYDHGTTLSGDWVPGATPPNDGPGYHPDPAISRVEGAAIHPERFSHAVLWTRHHQQMRDFFREIAGLPLLPASDPDISIYGAPAARYGFAVALLHSDPGATASRCHHLSFEVGSAEELEAAETRLAQAGKEIVSKLRTDRKSSIFVRDPDDMLVEFVTGTGGVPEDSSSDLQERGLYV